MRRGRWAAHPDELQAASFEGIISARRLEELGVPETTSYRRCRSGGPWTLLLPATILLHSGVPTRRQREIAALVYAGPGAMLTGMSAGRHLGLRRGSDPTTVHVLVPHARQVASSGFVVVERTRRLPAAVSRDGLLVAPLVRAVCDEARRLHNSSDIAALLAEPVQRRFLLPESLGVELDAGCRKGTSVPRHILAAVLDGARSAAEVDSRRWWLAHPELPPIRWNVRVLDARGHLVAIADGVVEEVGFVWETDSVEAHFATPEQVNDTAVRRRALRSEGLYVESHRPTQTRDDSPGVLRDVLHGLELAALLPPPRVTYAPDLPRSA